LNAARALRYVDAVPRVTVLYHYMHPDDVVSARQFDGLCEGLAARGWEVVAMPGNRGCRDEAQRYLARERWNGVDFRRVWRPPLRQASSVGRLANAGWMIGAWGLHAGAGRAPADVVLVGTDPVMSVAVAPVLKRMRPGVRVAHWAHDLYPEAAFADGLLDPASAPARALGAAARAGYHACDLVADLGPCMRERLRAYGHSAREATLVPWALSEPAQPLSPPPDVRRELFGDAALGLLYSGNFGRAHAYEGILALARLLRDAPIRFCFAVRGNRADELRRAVTPEDTNIGFAGFCAESELERRLAAADVHVASLRPEWSGVVVPSKFFGSLAAGRPVIFSGPEGSSLARWIREHDVGWVLSLDRLDEVAAALRAMAKERAALERVWARCHAVYHAHFSRARTLGRWDEALRGLLSDKSA
jgi:glycosyltransferase involved in cell wall biosynthesis